MDTNNSGVQSDLVISKGTLNTDCIGWHVHLQRRVLMPERTMHRMCVSMDVSITHVDISHTSKVASASVFMYCSVFTHTAFHQEHCVLLTGSTGALLSFHVSRAR